MAQWLWSATDITDDQLWYSRLILVLRLVGYGCNDYIWHPWQGKACKQA